MQLRAIWSAIALGCFVYISNLLCILPPPQPHQSDTLTHFPFFLGFKAGFVILQLVSFQGLHNKILQTEWVKQQKFVLS